MIGLNHYFDVEIAKMYGVNAAVILQNLAHWIQKNEANDNNFYDGNYWTYNSKKAFAELFPYLSKRQISNALAKLIDNGIIITGNYNKSAYDRTLWYALTEKGKNILHMEDTEMSNANCKNVKSIMQKCKMETAKMSNGNCENVQPIPYINTDTKPNSKTNNKPEPKSNTEIDEIINYLNLKAGTSFKAKTKDTVKHINARLSEGFTVDDFKVVIDKKCADWLGTEWQQYLRPATLFGTKFESYLNAKQKRPFVQQPEPTEKTATDIALDSIFS